MAQGDRDDEKVICVYCLAIEVKAEELGEDYFEGVCGACGRRVDYDYDPHGIIRFENGKAVYASG